MYQCAALKPLVTFCAREIGYAGDYEVSFYWEVFDGLQGYRCCEGQQLRFVTRKEAQFLPMPSYLGRVWNLAIKGLQASRDSRRRIAELQ